MHDPTLKLFSPLVAAAAAENNRADPGAKALNNREREIMLIVSAILSLGSAFSDAAASA
jgi:hypothetical protein